MSTNLAELQKTPLFEAHQALGAKLTDFGGFAMPLQYTKVFDEHWAVRKACGMFDISHMGLLMLQGSVEEIAAALDKLVPQNIVTLQPGKAVYTQLTNADGGILDDIIIYHLPPKEDFDLKGEFLVICNAGNRQKVSQWLQQQLPKSISQHFANEFAGLIALQGPQANAVLNAIGLEPIQAIPSRFSIKPMTIHGASVWVSRTGYTGEDGVEIIIPLHKIQGLWQHCISLCSGIGLLPCGLAARDSLRLEAAYPLYGQDLLETITPIEAGLGWSVPKAKTADYLGKTVLLAQKEQGAPRQTICLEMIEPNAIARSHFEVQYEGQVIGEITSGGFSPVLNKAIAMALVTPYNNNPLTKWPLGAIVHISMRNKLFTAKVVERPFYKSSPIA